MKRIIITTLMIFTAFWMIHRTEIDFGRVLNDNGDGKLYNGESYYNYIAYPDYYEENDIIMTVCLLNPLNTYCDDIIYRTDFRLFKNV